MPNNQNLTLQEHASIFNLGSPSLWWICLGIYYSIMISYNCKLNGFPVCTTKMGGLPLLLSELANASPICPSVCMLSRFSCVWFCVTLWSVAHQDPLSMGFSSQEYWSGLSCPPPGYLPDPGIEPMSLMIPALAGRFFITNATWEALFVQEAVHTLIFRILFPGILRRLNLNTCITSTYRNQYKLF